MAILMRWSWDKVKDKIRTLPGRLGFEKSNTLYFFGLRLDIESGMIYDELLERYLDEREAASLYYVLSVYADTKQDIGESNELVSLSRQLCPFIHCPNLRRNIEGIEKLFGEDPKMLYRVAKPFNYKTIDLGDAAIKIYALPRVPIILVIWGGEEGIPPSSEILFDKTAFNYLGSDISTVCEAAMGLARALTARLIISTAKELGIDIRGIPFSGYRYTCAD